MTPQSLRDVREAADAVLLAAENVSGNPICPCCHVKRWNRAEHEKSCPLVALKAALALPDVVTDGWRHVQRGTIYNVIGTATVQSTSSIREGMVLVIYRGEDGKLWARPDEGSSHMGIKPSKFSNTLYRINSLLAAWNDDAKTFNGIARWLEKTYLPALLRYRKANGLKP